jgi:DNA-binding response OmpR family regulator
MVSALICTHSDLEPELAATPLWRADVERHMASKLEEARMMAVAARPQIVVVDSSLPWAGRLVSGLREDPGTRTLSIVVVARGDFDPSEVELLESGANAIVRLPASTDAAGRLQQLMDIPGRRDIRFNVEFRVEARPAGTSEAQVALALNLSVNGLLMDTPEILQSRQELSLQLRLPGDGEPLRACGRVVRIASARQYGVEFTEIDPAARARLRRFLDGLGES